jgi:hypothetical protein
LDKQSLEFGEALQKVAEEFETLTAGRENMTVKEMLDVRDYARLRTDLSKADTELTNEQGAWKMTFGLIDDQLGKSLTPEQKRNIDTAQEEFFVVAEAQDATMDFAKTGARIEELFVQQYDTISFHFNETENDYKVKEAKFSKVMLDSSLKPEIRKQYAESVLGIVETYRNGPMTTLRKVNRELQRLLSRCAPMLDYTSEQNPEPEVKTVIEKARQWLALSEELFLARALATNGIITAVEIDTRLPAMVIEKGGNVAKDVPLSKEESERYTKEIATCSALFKESHAQNERIQKEREPLTKELFASSQTARKETAEPTPVAPPRPPNPLEPNTWFSHPGRFVR